MWFTPLLRTIAHKGLLCLLVFLCHSLYASRTDSLKTVRMPVFPFAQLMEVDTKGMPTGGYAYDYIEILATYARWKVEYIPCAGFSDGLEKLLKGEADIFFDVSYTSERAGQMLFPDQPMGREYYHLYARSDDTRVLLDNNESLNGLSVGVTRGTLQIELLRRWCVKHGIKLRHVEYEGLEKEKAFLSGAVDLDLEIALLLNDPRLSVVAPIGSADYYLVANKARKDLLEDINLAHTKILGNDPYYFAHLEEQHFAASISNHALSKDEKTWLAHHKTLRVGYFDNYMPLSKVGPDGQPTGAIVDILPEILDKLHLTGKLTLEYVPFEKHADGYRAVENGSVDLMFPAYVSERVRRDYDIIGSKPIATFANDLAFVGAFTEKKTRRIGVNRDNLIQDYYSRDVYPEAKIVYYDNIFGCLDGLLAGTSDGTVLNGHRTKALLKPGWYSKLNTGLIPRDYRCCMAIAGDNVPLMHLMNRGIGMLDRNLVAKTLYSHISSLYGYTLGDFVREHLILVLSIILAFLLLLISALVYLRIGNVKLAGLNRKLKVHAETINRQRQEEATLRAHLEQNQQKLKDALDRSVEAEKARSLFFSTVSHDIRTPLNAIIGFSELLQSGDVAPDEMRRDLAMIRTSGKTLLELINDLLDLSKLEAGKMEILPEPICVPPLVNEILDVFRPQAENAHQHLVADLAPLPILMLDPHRLRQVLFNLISNAVKYAGPCTIHIKAKFADGLFTFTVADDGVGLSAEEAQRLFQPYAQASNASHKQGTGLGLHICRQLVERAGGTISLDSAPGKGFSFRASIPSQAVEGSTVKVESSRAPVSEASGSQPSTFTPQPSTALHVLAVDDSAMNQTVIKAMLKKLGITDVTLAGNGREALVQLGAAAPFDLVLTDMWMPEMDGEALLKALRADPRFATLKVCAVTADVEAQKTYKEQGFDALLLKPVTLERLRALLLEVLGNGAI